jgi:NADH-quinone oxidoreductase subunit J
MHQALFIVLAVICVGAAINLLAQRHPINSALSLIVVMASLAGFYVLLGAEFVAALQIIIYAGAIMVLFVFVIMLLNAGEEERTTGSRVAGLLGWPALALFLALFSYALLRPETENATLRIGEFVGSTQAMGRMLFREYLLPFEVTSVLILIAIMGAVVLARREV